MVSSLPFSRVFVEARRDRPSHDETTASAGKLPRGNDVDTQTPRMHPFSDYASFILDRMEPGRRYEPQDLRVFVPDTSAEHLREIMHELWVNRQVERAGSGWRRHRSASPHVVHPIHHEVRVVKPEDLFDHDTFAGFFK